MQELIVPSIPNAFWINALALLFGVVLPLPLLGMLSDYCGRIKTMVVGAVGIGVLGPLCLLVISQGQPTRAFFAQWFMGTMLSFYGGPISAWLVERFPVKGKLQMISRAAHVLTLSKSLLTTHLLSIYHLQ